MSETDEKQELNDPGPRSDLAWLPINKLKVDERYQRDTSSNRSKAIINKIARELVWRRFGAIAVVPDDDEWFVVDGQHRVEAVRMRGDVTHVPGVVMNGISAAKAAADFVAINKDRVRLTPQQEYKAMVEAGDPVACGAQLVADSVGFEILKFPLQVSKQKPGQTLAVSTLLWIYKTQGEAILSESARRIMGAYPDTPGALSANLLKAVALVIEQDKHAGLRISRRMGTVSCSDLIAAGLERRRPGVGGYIALAEELRDDPHPQPAPEPGATSPAAIAPEAPQKKMSDSQYTADDLAAARRGLDGMGFDVDTVGNERYQVGSTVLNGVELIAFHRRMAAEGRRARA